MNCSLGRLFDLMEGEGDAGVMGGCGELFAEIPIVISEGDFNLIMAVHSREGTLFSAGPGNALPQAGRLLFELSVNAFDACLLAWMSELPVTAEIIRFGRKVLAAAAAAPDAGRREAERAATDRSDPDVLAVLETAYKAGHEINRLHGLLRFCPNEDGIYIARCEPDHFILPALGPHFWERFGQIPWAIIDEKRRLCLRCIDGTGPELRGADEVSKLAGNLPGGEWENLWRHYHKTVNNESRNNPCLQKKFMPKRYWKYLTEMQP